MSKKKIDKQVVSALGKFGLSVNETKVYVAAVQAGETSPYALAKITGIARTTVYDVLTGLALKGLIELEQSDGFSKQQTKIRAKNPSVLRSILQQKRKELVKAEVDIVHILPLLKGEFHGSSANANFQFFPGIEGAKRVCFHQFNSGLPRIVWDNLMPMDVFGASDMNQFTSHESQVNIELGVLQRELIPLTDWTKHVLSYQVGRDSRYLDSRQIRYIDNPLFSNKLSVIVEDRRIYIACANDDEVWGLIITSQTMAEFLASLFEIEWLRAVPVTLDLVKSWGENEYLREEMGASS